MNELFKPLGIDRLKFQTCLHLFRLTFGALKTLPLDKPNFLHFAAPTPLGQSATAHKALFPI